MRAPIGRRIQMMGKVGLVKEEKGADKKKSRRLIFKGEETTRGRSEGKSVSSKEVYVEGAWEYECI